MGEAMAMSIHFFKLKGFLRAQCGKNNVYCDHYTLFFTLLHYYFHGFGLTQTRRLLWAASVVKHLTREMARLPDVG